MPLQRRAAAPLPCPPVPPPPAVLLHLDDFAGGRCRAVVSAGQRVLRGEPVGISAGGAWVHAPVSGVVRAVRGSGLVLENDCRDAPGADIEPLASLEDAQPHRVLERLTRSGLLTADLRPLPQRLTPCHALALAVLTQTDEAVFFALLHQVLGGVRALGRLAAPRRLLLFYSRGLRAVAQAARQLSFPAEAVAVDAQAPGLEALLAGRALEPGVTLGDLGLLVFSPREAAALYDAIYLGQPYLKTTVLILGPGVRERTVRTVPLGTSVRHLLQATRRTAPTVLLGDAKTGQILRNLDTPLGKGDGLITCLTGRRLTPADRD